MTKKTTIMILIGSMLIGCVIAYALGVAKVMLFQSTADGTYGLVNICDVNPDDVDENNNCLNYNKTQVTLREAEDIGGSKWVGFGSVIGFFTGVLIIVRKEKKY